MANAYGKVDDDEDNVLVPKEPQVTSQDPEERKAARFLRIKRRQEALKRAEQPADEITAEEEPGPIEQATAVAAEELQRLALDGAAKVTNVKVTTDEREVIRRSLFSEKMKDSLQKIEEEATLAQIEYEAITRNWDIILTIKDPLDIDAEMKQQKQKCDELLEQKNELIVELKNDLTRMDAAYDEDLEKQDKDIKELSERIEKQVTIMQRAYEKQLSLIECAINIERETLIEHNNKRWEALYKQRDKEEVVHMEFKFEQLEEHKEEIESIMWDHHEKYRNAKIELESLIQELQKELEKLKSTCIINTEKIGYNYQILKKREEENVFVRSQQKRKLNKMSDVANTLRAKIRKAAEDGALEEIKADAEIVKLMQTMDDLEKKSNQFSYVNNYKFSQIWRMSAAKCGELVQELRKGEVALHAHILAEPPPPATAPPLKSPLSKYEHELSAKITPVLEPTESVDSKNMVAKEAKEKLVRHILQLVADNTGFLIENRLFTLIEKYQLASRNLCTLDAVFMVIIKEDKRAFDLPKLKWQSSPMDICHNKALEIQAEEDIELLCETFLNYAFCPICMGLEEASELLEASSASQEESQQAVRSVRGDRVSIRGRPSIARSISASTSRSVHMSLRTHELSPEDQILMSEADEIIQKCGDPQKEVFAAGTACDGGSAVVRRTGDRGVTMSSQPHIAIQKPGNRFLCPLGHHLEIEPMQVLTALGEFIKVFVPPDKKKLYDILDSVKPPSFDTPSRKLTVEEIEQYWSQWKNVFPSQKDTFWDGLLTGLNNYLTILQERETLHSEVVQLRRRNAGLRRLIRGTLPELPVAVSKYAQPYPPSFTASCPDESPEPITKLPPI